MGCCSSSPQPFAQERQLLLGSSDNEDLLESGKRKLQGSNESANQRKQNRVGLDNRTGGGEKRPRLSESQQHPSQHQQQQQIPDTKHKEGSKLIDELKQTHQSKEAEAKKRKENRTPPDFAHYEKPILTKSETLSSLSENNRPQNILLPPSPKPSNYNARAIVEEQHVRTTELTPSPLKRDLISVDSPPISTPVKPDLRSVASRPVPTPVKHDLLSVDTLPTPSQEEVLLQLPPQDPPRLHVPLKSEVVIPPTTPVVPEIQLQPVTVKRQDKDKATELEEKQKVIESPVPVPITETPTANQGAENVIEVPMQVSTADKGEEKVSESPVSMSITETPTADKSEENIIESPMPMSITETPTADKAEDNISESPVPMSITETPTADKGGNKATELEENVPTSIIETPTADKGEENVIEVPATSLTPPTVDKGKDKVADQEEVDLEEETEIESPRTHDEGNDAQKSLTRSTSLKHLVKERPAVKALRRLPSRKQLRSRTGNPSAEYAIPESQSMIVRPVARSAPSSLYLVEGLSTSGSPSSELDTSTEVESSVEAPEQAAPSGPKIPKGGMSLLPAGFNPADIKKGLKKSTYQVSQAQSVIVQPVAGSPRQPPMGGVAMPGFGRGGPLGVKLRPTVVGGSQSPSTAPNTPPTVKEMLAERKLKKMEQGKQQQ
jgi:hypothetical protein